VSVNPSSIAGDAAPRRRSWAKPALMVVAALAGAGIGIGIAVANRTSSPSADAAASGPGATWAAGARPAPNFQLRGQNGRPITLRSLRGRPVILTFIDPVCRNLCPLEAKVLDAVPGKLPAGSRPAIVAVSVNPWGQAPVDLRQDAQKWKLPPEWQWALGGYKALAQVWGKYAIGVRVRTKTLAGVTVHEVDHTEAAYVIDASGHERALFLFPYTTADVVKTLRGLGG
jgi:cytochrome oxidase Cu insertion factor (SCO1/SenC/PrrC family)